MSYCKEKDVHGCRWGMEAEVTKTPLTRGRSAGRWLLGMNKTKELWALGGKAGGSIPNKEGSK